MRCGPLAHATQILYQKTDRAGFAIGQVLSQNVVNQLFNMSPRPSLGYTGAWISDSSFVVTIVTPSSEPEFGTATVRVSNGLIINNAKVPLPAAADLGTLTGSWGSIYVLWKNPVNVLIEGNKLTRPSSAGEAWDGGAASSRTFIGDGYMETIVTQRGKNRMIGFSASDSDQHFITLDFAFFLHQSGALESYENGVQTGYLSQYKEGDTLRLQRSGSEMMYYINGLLRRSTEVAPALGLKVDCSLSARGSTFDNTILVLGSARAATTAEPIRDAVSIQLKAGWNLIGIPLILDNDDPSQLSPSVNTLDAPATALQVGQGYWVFAVAPKTVILTGQRPQQPIPTNGLFAPVANSAIPVGATARSFADGSWRQMPADRELEAGMGYWLLK